MKRKLVISRYKSRFDKDKDLSIGRMTWDQLCAVLGEFKITGETFEEYTSMETLDKLKIKDVGYFVGGLFDPPRRKTFNLISRSVLTLDLDHLESWDIDEIQKTYEKYAYLVHSSHSHSQDSPRLRLVMPLSRDVSPEEYEPLARRVASLLEMDMFDDSTYQYSRIMFRPSCSSDGDRHLDINEGAWLDPDKILDLYEDWQDFGEWPVSSREGRVRVSAVRAQDPFTKPGAIGAFNRAFSIPEAIETFDLPYTESGQGDGRYTFTDGTSADGAIYYPDDGHLFSHHDSDPAKGNQNAWDLVRIHKFGELDKGKVDEDTPMSKRPSQQEMQVLVGGRPEVISEMASAEGFEDLGELETVDEEGEKKKIKRSELSFEAIRELIATLSSDHGRLTTEEVKDIVLRVAAAGPEIEEAERGVLAAQLKDVYTYDGATKGGILEDFKAKSKLLRARGSDGKEIRDIQVEFLRHFLDSRYAGGAHLRRTGKQFWAFNDTHWVQRPDEIIQGELFESIVQLRIDADTRKERKELAAAVGESQTSSIFGSLWAMFTAGVAFDTVRDGDGADPMGLIRQFMPRTINCSNGTIDFRDDGRHKLRKHEPLDLYTSAIDVAYDKDSECPEWDRFCEMTFSLSDEPDDMQRHLEELMGYMLNQSREMRAWVLFYGGTGSGKSTVGKVLNALLGASVKNMTMLNYKGSNSHATAGLIGKQLLLDDDYPEGELLNDGFLKSVSEEKQLEANPKGRDEYSFVARVVPLILSNNPPSTKDTTGALYDRALVFPFNHMLPRAERDERRMRAMIRTELPGILARCIKGYGRLVKRKDWLFPNDCTEAWEKWILQSNPLKMFISEYLVEDEKALTKATDVWEAYLIWWREESGAMHGGTRMAGRRNTFYRRLEQAIGSVRIRHNTEGLAWRGWAIKEGVLPEEDF